MSVYIPDGITNFCYSLSAASLPVGGKAAPGGCPCCRALPDRDADAGEWVKAVAPGVNLAFNTPDDHVHPLDPHQNREVLRKAPGCGMSVDGGWNEFWDR